MKKVLFVTVCSLAFALPAAAQTPQCTVPNTLTAILAFEGEGRVVLYEGSYAQFRDRGLETKVALPSTTKSTVRSEAPTPKPTAPKLKTRRTFKEEQVFKSMEADILAAEETVQALQDEVNDPAIIRELGAKMSERLQTLSEAEQKVEKLYAQWARLSELDPYGA